MVEELICKIYQRKEY